MKMTTALYPNITRSTLPSETPHIGARPSSAERSQKRSDESLLQSHPDYRRGGNNQGIFSPLTIESSQDSPQRGLPLDQDKPTNKTITDKPQAGPETSQPIRSDGLQTLLSVQQFAQSEKNIAKDMYQSHIAAYDRVEQSSPRLDDSPQILSPTSDGEAVESYRSIDFSI